MCGATGVARPEAAWSGVTRSGVVRAIRGNTVKCITAGSSTAGSSTGSGSTEDGQPGVARAFVVRPGVAGCVGRRY